MGGGCVSQVRIVDAIDVSCIGAGSSGAGTDIVHVREHNYIRTNQHNDLPIVIHVLTPYVNAFALLGEMHNFVPLSSDMYVF